MTSANERAEGVVQIDGVSVSAGDARVAALDRGFLYGDSAFEALRTYGGVPFRLREHLARLAHSCARLRMPAPDLAALAVDVNRAVRASDLDECYLRVVVTRGLGPIGIDPGAPGTSRTLVYALPLRLPPPDFYTRGVAVALVHGARDPALGGIKTGNYLAAVLAVAAAGDRGASEAVLLGASGEIAEGATSNVFVARDGVVRTPPLSTGILEGITRRVVIELSRETGSPAVEALLFPPDLYRADEVFITSSIREVVPVVRVDDVRVGSGAPGPLARRLAEAYRAHVRGWRP
jgi:branched-chain amino acid aminotransferase